MPTPEHDLIASVVEDEHKAQLRNSSALDTKAGLLLGVAGLLASLATQHTSGWRTVSLVFFAAGAFFAILSLLVRPGYSIDPNLLRARYSQASFEEMSMRLLDTRCDQYLRAAQLLSFKTAFFLIGAMAVAGAVITLVVALLTIPAKAM